MYQETTVKKIIKTITLKDGTVVKQKKKTFVGNHGAAICNHKSYSMHFQNEIFCQVLQTNIQKERISKLVSSIDWKILHLFLIFSHHI